MALSTGHHALIQTLMSKGPRTETETKLLVGKLVEDATLESVVKDVNASLLVLQLEIRRAVNQKDGSVWVGVVNRAADRHAKLGTKYSHQQIQFFKAIVEHIVLNSGGTGLIGNIEVNNIVIWPAEPAEGDPSSSQRLPVKPLTVEERERAVDQLVADKLLERSGGGEAEEDEEEQERPGAGLKLGVRTYLELRQYLKSIDGMPICAFCEEAAVEARCCEKEDCDCWIHFYCERQKFRRAQRALCPACDTAWPYIPPVGAREAPSGSQGTNLAGGSQVRRKKMKANR